MSTADPLNGAPRTGADNHEKRNFWRNAIESSPPRVRFAAEIRNVLVDHENSFDHIEFMMFTLEHHPLIPFEK